MMSANYLHLLKEYGILTVVDSVAGMVGEPIDVDQNQIDICCGGTQKAISAPVGLAIVSISEDAKKAMNNRNTPIASYYANLQIFEGYIEKRTLPYTMPAFNIEALDIALDNILKEGSNDGLSTTCKNCERGEEVCTRIWTNIIPRIRILQYSNGHHHSRGNRSNTITSNTSEKHTIYSLLLL